MGLVAVDGTERLQHATGVVATPHRHPPRTRDLENRIARLRDDLNKPFNLRRATGHLEHDGLGSEVDNAGAKNSSQLKDLRPGVLPKRMGWPGRDLDQTKLANNSLAATHLIDIDSNLQLIKRSANAMRRMVRRLANNRHTRDLSPLGLPYSERNNVDVEPPKKRRNPRKNAGLILHQSYKSVEHVCLSVWVLIWVWGRRQRSCGVAGDVGLRNFEEDELAGLGRWFGAAAEIAGGDSRLEDRRDGVVRVEFPARAAVGVHVREDSDGGLRSSVYVDDAVLVGCHGDRSNLIHSKRHVQLLVRDGTAGLGIDHLDVNLRRLSPNHRGHPPEEKQQ